MGIRAKKYKEEVVILSARSQLKSILRIELMDTKVYRNRGVKQETLKSKRMGGSNRLTAMETSFSSCMGLWLNIPQVSFISPMLACVLSYW